MLNLFRPMPLGGDSLRVIAEWLIYEPGELFWGVEAEPVRSGCDTAQDI